MCTISSEYKHPEAAQDANNTEKQIIWTERSCASQGSLPGWIEQRAHFSGETQPRAFSAIPTGMPLKHRFAKPTSLCKHQLHHINYTVKFIRTRSIFANELLAAKLRLVFFELHIHTHSVAHEKEYDKEKFKHQLTQAYTHLEKDAIYSAEFTSQKYMYG